MSQHRTAQEIADQRDAAARAVRQLWDADATTSDEVRERAARRQLWLAWTLDGTTPAQVASLAGVRQLEVALLLDDDAGRAAALVTARHDARRYARRVDEAIRDEALRRWSAATDDGQQEPPTGTKARIADALGITRRADLDRWIAEWEAEWAHATAAS